MAFNVLRRTCRALATAAFLRCVLVSRTLSVHSASRRLPLHASRKASASLICRSFALDTDLIACASDWAVGEAPSSLCLNLHGNENIILDYGSGFSV